MTSWNYGSVVADTLAGFAGGVTAVMVGQPMDTIKVKMQLYPDVYGGIVSCVTRVVRQRGLRGLYAGTAPALVSNCAENAVLFATYGQCQKLLVTTAETDLKFALQNAYAGGVASVFTSLVLCPAELVKIRLQGAEAARAKRPSMRGTVRCIWKVDGFRGMYRGFWATLARESVGCSVFFGFYEWARRAVVRGRSEGNDGLANVAAAAGATLLTGVVTCPIDVIKSRVQTSTSKHGYRYRPIWDEARAAGLRSLYFGLRPSLAKSVPITSLLMYTVERVKPLLRKLFLPPAVDPPPPSA